MKESVKVLGINGSPRKYGNTYKLLRLALEAAKMEGADTELIHLYDYEIKPCIGCLCDEQTICRYPCVIEDDMRSIYDMILEAHALIIATPVYWYSPSAVVKNFIDRLTAFENMITIKEYGRSLLEGKVAGIIACGNDSGCILAISQLYAILVSMGLSIPPWALAYYNKMGDVLEDENAVIDAINVGRVVVMMARSIREIDKWYDSEWARRMAAKLKENIRKEVNNMARKQLPEREKTYRKFLAEDSSTQL